MEYRAISADGHVNEPPTLWQDRLPDKFKDRGPRIIETPNTKGHAWIMEGQKRPSPMGFSSMYSRASKRFDRASLVDSFKTDQGPRRALRGRLPGLVRPGRPGQGDPRGRNRCRGDLQRRTDGVERHQALPDPELSFACIKVYNDWIAEFQAYAPERFVCNGTMPTTGIEDALAELHRCAEMGLRTVQLESYPSGSFSAPSPEDDRFWAAAVELGMPVNVHTQFFFPAGDLGSKRRRAGRTATGRTGQEARLDVTAASFPVILTRMITSGVFERFPDLGFIGTEELHRLGPLLPGTFRRLGQAQPPSIGDCHCYRASTSTATLGGLHRRRSRPAGSRYDVGVGNIMWGPDFPHSTSSWPVRLPTRSRDFRACRCDSSGDRADHVAYRGRPLQDPVRRAGPSRSPPEQ